jgi:CRP/FNR family transcriptional regulator
LRAGDCLFQAGDTRARLYRVERGALCHYRSSDGGHHEVIEFAFPGDIIGFGHLERHLSSARAMVETVVSAVSAPEFACALEYDGQLAARYAAAADREFDDLRERAVRNGASDPVKRLAAFLAAVAQLGAVEGRDPTLVTDELGSGFVADQLGMTIDRLQSALRELERRGVVSPGKDGLRIADIDALEELAHVA